MKPIVFILCMRVRLCYFEFSYRFSSLNKMVYGGRFLTRFCEFILPLSRVAPWHYATTSWAYKYSSTPARFTVISINFYVISLQSATRDIEEVQSKSYSRTCDAIGLWV